jgi:long-chain fatty acid transport protein
MKRTLISFAVLGTILGAAGAQAGGFDRSGQDTSIIFKEGSLLEITSVSVSPKATGTYSPAGDTGEVLPNYSFNTIAFRTDINDNFSVAVIQDQPFGASVDWIGGDFNGVKANIESDATTALISYAMADNMTIYGGVKSQTFKASAEVPFVGAAIFHPTTGAFISFIGDATGYSISSTKDSSLGYVVGAAFEKPEIAMRVALTYHTKVDHEVSIVETVGGVDSPAAKLSASTPEAFNLDFQTGIAENTLLFGTIRHVKWTQFLLDPAQYNLYSGEKKLKEFTSNVTNYSLGLGRKFTDQWSGAVTYGTEAAEGVDGGPLGPTDGYKKLGLGVTYTAEKATVTLAVQKVNMGDIKAVAGPYSAAMANNTSLVTAVKIGYKF